MKSKHLVCLSFLWWQVFLREREKIFHIYFGPRMHIQKKDKRKATLDNCFLTALTLPKLQIRFLNLAVDLSLHISLYYLSRGNCNLYKFPKFDDLRFFTLLCCEHALKLISPTIWISNFDTRHQVFKDYVEKL